MNWWENTNNTEQDAVSKQQRAYIKAFYLDPEVHAHLRLCVASMSNAGMTTAEACIAGQARDQVLQLIRKNAGVVDELAIIKAEGEIAMASPIRVTEPDNGLEGYVK